MKNKQGFFLTKLLLCLLLIVTSFNYALKAEEPDDDGDNTVDIEEHVNGYIESDLDRGLEAYYPEVSSYTNDLLETKYPNTTDPIQTIKATYPASRNQNPFGTCWAFASTGLVEFDLVKNHGYSADIDLSEFQLIYNTFYSVTDPLKNTKGDTSTYDNTATGVETYLNHGGDFVYTMSRLTQWASPVSENSASYPPNSSSSTYIPDALSDSLAYSSTPYHLENVYLVNLTTNSEDAKKLIKEYGAIGTSYYDSSVYYGQDSNGNYTYFEDNYTESNHAIMIVGWDDNYLASNFTQGTPTSNGAWLVRNSWGDYRNYFWMSYETKSIQNITAYAYDVVVDNYKYNYQLDGGIFSSYSSVSKIANVFTVQNKNNGEYDVLKSINISLTHDVNVGYTVDVYTELTDANDPTSGTPYPKVASGTTSYKGIYTIKLDKNVFLKPNTNYSIVVTFDDDTWMDTEYAFTTESQWTQNVAINNYSYRYYYGWTPLKTSTLYSGFSGNYRLKGFANDAYTLTYNYNYEGAPENTSTILEAGSNYTFPSNPTRTGYRFVGWYNAPENGDEVTAEKTISATTTVYAHWEEIEMVTITFNTNGGTLDDSTSSPKTYEVGQQYGTLPTATKEGYDFEAWYTDATNGVKIDSTDTASKALTTLYAHYTPHQYSIVYNGNGAEGSMANDKATYGQDKILTTNTFYKTGYSFKEWNTKADGTGTSYGDKGTVNSLTPNKDGSVTLYAQWNANNYTIKYDAHDGTGTMNDTSATYDQSVTLSKNTYTKTNYTFVGWNTKSDGTGTSYSDGQSVTNLTSSLNGAVTLYAQWMRTPHTVYFDANGGTVTPTSKTVEEGGAYLTLPTPTKTGYYFQGWYTAEDGGEKIDYNSTVGTSDVTLHAHWAAETYTYNIVYKTLSGKQLATDNVSSKFDTTIDVSPNKDFEGYTTPNSQSIKWDSTEAKTITFIYEPINYTISYELNGGTNASSNPVSYNIESSLITLSNPTLTGNTFKGWYTDKDFTTETNTLTSGSTGDKKFYAKWDKNSYTYTIKYVSKSLKELKTSTTLTKEYGASETISAPNDIKGYNTPASQTVTWDVASDYGKTITFVYEPIEYSITYNDLNGADNSTNKTSYTIEDTVLTLKDISLEGYTFNGWYSDEELTNKITSIDTSKLENINVYAKWTVNQYKLTYSLDTNKGSLDEGQETSITLDYGTKYGTLPNVTPINGYRFNGWYTLAEGGAKVDENTTMPASDTTIYAHIEEIVYNPYTLTFDGNGGTPSEISRTVKETKEIGELPSANRIGYTFNCWYTLAEGGDKVESTYIMPSSNLTIYAHWNVNSYKLTLLPDSTSLLEKNVNYNEALGELPAPEDKLGYEFIGWFDGDVEYTAESKMPAKELTLIAHWKALEKPTIRFDGNGGTSSMDGGQVNFDGSLVGELPTATRKGYTFVGWYTEANGGTKLENDSNFKDISEIYAHWDINYYTINFDSDGGSEEEQISVEYDSTYFDSLPTPTKDKYRFLGWYTSDGQEVNENSKISDSNITLYAKWEYIPQAYILTLDYNDGTSKKEERSIIENKEYGELPSLTRDGYIFDGWYDGLIEGNKVSSNTTMDSKDVTIYAHWIKIDRTIKLNANLNGVDDLSIYVGENNKFIGNLPTLNKSGKNNFAGWYTDPINGKEIKDDSDLTGINELYAHWIKDPGEVIVIEPKTEVSTKDLEPKLNIEDSTVNNLLTDKEKEEVNKGDDADIYLTVLEGKDDKEINLAKNILGTNTFGQALDITLNIKVGDSEPRKITDSKDEVTITIDLPKNLINNDSSKTRTYYVIRVHDGKAEYIDTSYNAANNTIVFKTSKFSTYLIAYKDSDNSVPSSNTNHAVTCEEYMHSNNWTWSEKSQKCVFKVSNTGTK